MKLIPSTVAWLNCSLCWSHTGHKSRITKSCVTVMYAASGGWETCFVKKIPHSPFISQLSSSLLSVWRECGLKSYKGCILTVMGKLKEEPTFVRKRKQFVCKAKISPQPLSTVFFFIDASVLRWFWMKIDTLRLTSCSSWIVLPTVWWSKNVIKLFNAASGAAVRFRPCKFKHECFDFCSFSQVFASIVDMWMPFYMLKWKMTSWVKDDFNCFQL